MHEPYYTKTLQDIQHFSRAVIGRPLYPYQLQAARAVIKSVRLHRGHEFLIVMSRQSGKNETISQLLVYLLNIYSRAGGSIVYAAIGDNIGRGLRRLEEHLDNPWNKGRWKREARPTRRTLGKASVVFLSSHPQAHARGQTAHHLLVVDELQDQDPAHLQAVFQPMRAAYNATAVYLGTVRTTHDALWRKKEQLERQQARDAVRRVYMAGPGDVCPQNEHYGRFLAAQIAQHGRDHPLIASEYYLQPIDDAAGLFPPRRLALLHGSHIRRIGPHFRRIGPHFRRPGPHPIPHPTSNNTAFRTPNSAFDKSEIRNPKFYLATLDVAGIDEGPSGALDPSLKTPARDYTVCTIFAVDDDPNSDAGPIYRALDIFVDHGTPHFQTGDPASPSLAQQLLAYLRHWGITHLIGDAGGVGEGLLDWLAHHLGPSVVTPFKFTPRSKAQLGVNFLALVETNRFKYWRQEHEYDDAWYFYRQAAACAYDLPPGRPLETHMSWSVPPTVNIATPAGLEPLHDDRLISAALIAHADTLIKEGKIKIGRAQSSITAPYDPLNDLPPW